MKLIGITGRKRSGKDSLANIIIEHDTLKFDKVSFADSMRDIMYEVCSYSYNMDGVILKYDWSVFNYEEYKELECLTINTSDNFFQPTIIKLLSYNADSTEKVMDNGVEFIKWCRQFSGRFFSPREFLQKLGTDFGREQIGENVWVEMLLGSLEKDGAYIIPDVRFDNEAILIKNLGGVIFKTERPGNEEVIDLHNSENGVSEYLIDAVFIANNLSELSEEWLSRIVDLSIKTKITGSNLPPEADYYSGHYANS